MRDTLTDCCIITTMPERAFFTILTSLMNASGGDEVSALLEDMATRVDLSNVTISVTGRVTIPSLVISIPLEINDTSADHQYVLAVSELAADRTITLPLLTGNDVFVFADFIQTLTNKTLALGSNTVSGTLAQFNTAVTDDNLAGLAAANTFTAAGNNFDELLAVDKGLSFPATQVASAGANDLDDYEEGIFTITIGGSTSESGQVYSIQVGRYVKIGKIVHIHGRVRLSTLGTITGNVQFKGLPFTVVNITDAFSVFSMGFFQNLTTSVTFLSGFLNPNTATADLVYVAAAATAMTSAAQADLSNLSGFVFSGSYETTA